MILRIIKKKNAVFVEKCIYVLIFLIIAYAMTVIRNSESTGTWLITFIDKNIRKQKENEYGYKNK